MARKGKDFEILIKTLESILLPRNAVIKSPDYFEDKITNQKREVDISIRLDVGSVPILIVIECRDRTADQDTTWIEQLHSKAIGINANKVIAVSSSGFSRNAIGKANHYGIETRTYSEVSKENIQEWFSLDFLDQVHQHYIIKEVNLKLDPLINEEILSHIDLGSWMITSTRNQSLVSLPAILLKNLRDYKVWDSIPRDGLIYEGPIHIIFDNPQDSFELEHNGIVSTIKEAIFYVGLQVLTNKIPISKITSYQGEQGTLAETIEFEGVLPDKNMIFQLIKLKDGSLKMSSRSKSL